jgi:ketosteroid isomerase-like protein
MAIPILPGKTDQWRRFVAELAGPRHADYVASRERLSVHERSFLQSTPQGDLAIVTVEGADPAGAISQFGAQVDPFAQWFREQVLEIHGFDLAQPPAGPPPELVIDSRPGAAEDNVQRAKDAYAAFVRGDLESVMRDMAEDIEWVAGGPADLPTSGTVRGKRALQAWFGTLAQGFDIQRFEPYQFVAQGDTVVVLIRSEGTVRHNQRRYTNEGAHVLTFRGGKLARFQGFEDTEATAAAYRGE